MSLDPYVPPVAPMNGPTPADMAATSLRYSTFWRRVGAGLLDFLLISPLLFMHFVVGDSRQFYLYSVIPTQLVTLFYYGYLVTRYGATPGKLLVGLRITMLDGSPVTAKAACLRYSMWWILALVSSVGNAMAAMATSPEAMAGGYMARSLALTANIPSWGLVASYTSQALAIASIIVMLVNKQRRTLHDFLAGTVVVRKK